MEHMGKLVVHRFLLAFHGIGTARRPGEAIRGVLGAGEAVHFSRRAEIKPPNPRYDWIFLEDLGVRYKIKYGLDSMLFLCVLVHYC